MDTFPIKRGIGLSRTPHPGQQITFPKEPIPYAQNYPIRNPLPPQITPIVRILQQPNEQPYIKPMYNHARTFSVGVPSQPQPPKEVPHQIPFQDGSLKQGQMPQHQSKFPHPLSSQETPQTVLMMQKIDGPQVSEQATKSIQLGIDRRSTSVSQSNGSTVLQAHQLPTSPTKVFSVPFKAQRSETLQSQLRPVSEAPQLPILATSAVQDSKVRQLSLQNLELQQEFKKKQEQWRIERQSLLKKIQQQASNFADLQRKSAFNEQKLQKKAGALESELRLMKGNRTRLQLEIDSSKKLFKSQRDKNQKARQQMNKMIFFQDDLVHAKDYLRLKDELEQVHSENAKLYTEHQQFIVEVGENRRAADAKIIELQLELKKLKAQLGTLRTKLEDHKKSDEDKLTLIKLQNQLNFFRKKCDEQVELLRNKDAQIQSALNQLNELTKKDNNDNHHQDEITYNQIKDTVALYEARIADLNAHLLRSQTQAEKHRKTVELLTTQLRRTRQDRSINSLRERSNESNLKNDVEMLQKSFLCESEVKNKRISNLQEALQRKSKEIANRDFFIKDFLVTKVKQLPSNHAGILQTIYLYFDPEKASASTSQHNQIVD